MFAIPAAAQIHDPWLFWPLALLCALSVGLAKTGIPGIGILVVGVMASLFETGSSTGVLLPMLIVADIFALLYYSRHAIWAHAARTLPWAVCGIMAGWAAQDRQIIGQDQLRPAIGIIVILVLLLGRLVSWNGDRLAVPQRWWFAALVGIFGGFTTMTANAAGPIWVVYLLAMQIPKEAFLGTSGWIFFILNTAKLPFSYSLGYITADSLLYDIAMIPAIGLGALLGALAARKIPQRGFEIAVTLLALAAAVRLIMA